MYEFEKNKLYDLIGKNMVKTLKEYKCVVAGGCITSLFTRHEINDIDIYFKDNDSIIKALQELDDGTYILSSTNKAILFKEKETLFQYIHFRAFEDAGDIFNTFDFAVCMGAFDFETEEFIFHNDFFKDNSQRMLRFNPNTAFPIMSALRVEKYKNKGYEISKMEFIKIILTINNLNISTLEELKEQVGGMYGIDYTKVFEGIDGNNFNIADVVERLSKLCLSDEYFKQSERAYIPIFKIILNKLKQDNKCEFYELGSDNIVAVKNNNIIYTCDNSDESNIKTADYDGVMFVYKNVKRIGDKLFSYYDSNFEYKLYHDTVAQNKAGLFFAEDIDEVNGSNYRNGENRVVLKCIVRVSDYVDSGYWGETFRFKKCIPIEVIEGK